MKKHLNTLFVTTQGAYLAKERETVVVRVEHEAKIKLPMHTIGGIICFGNVACSPFLMGACAEKGIAISFLTEYGSVSGNVLLRREQYRRADSEQASADMARYVLTGKIANCRTVMRRCLRDHGDKVDSNKLENAISRLTGCLIQLERTDSLNSLRGIEGDAAGVYFDAFDELILSQKDDFCFTERSRRPPLDSVNCLLSFIYTLLMHDCRSGLESVGLDPAVGFLHRDRPGRPSLALDLMEEFRAFFADRMVLGLINLCQLEIDDFDTAENGAVTMSNEARKKVLVTYQKRKQDEIMHPFLQEKVSIGLLFHIQALLLARYLRGDLDGYPPFIWK